MEWSGCSSRSITLPTSANTPQVNLHQTKERSRRCGSTYRFLKISCSELAHHRPKNLLVVAVMRIYEKLNLIITISVALFCLSPLFYTNQVKSQDDALHTINIEAHVFSNPSIFAPFFVVLIPLADLLLDYPSRIVAYFNKEKGCNNATPTSTVVIRLTDIERLLFIIGIAIQSTVGFLPARTNVGVLSLVHKCTNNMSVMLTVGPILAFLSRCTSTFTPLRSLIILSTVALGLCIISISFFLRWYQQQWTNLLFTGSLVITIAWAMYIILIMVCIYKYCREKMIFTSDRQVWLMRLRNLCGRSQFATKKVDQSVDTDSELYTNYIPALHMIASITIACANAAVSYNPERSQVGAYEKQSYLVLLAEITVLVIELRIRKNEIARGLIALLESKKSYVRYISHELRTPLNTAFLGLKLLTIDLKASSDPVDINRYDTLCDVNMSCMAAVDILNDLLCYEKLESGILELHKEYIVIQPFLRDCVSMFSVQARECDVTMTVLTTIKEGMETETGDAPSDDEQQLPQSLRSEDSIFADKFKMDQVVRNLISNALKFTPRGGSVTIHATFVPSIRDEGSSISQTRTVDTGLSTPYVSASERNLISRDASDAGSIRGLINFSNGSLSAMRTSASASSRSDLIQGKLVITVSDTGAGISEENQARLFKEIVQFSPEKLQSGGGSGLGLWITAGIMDLHDGKISVFSRGEGMGTSFTVEIPMSRSSTTDTVIIREDTIPSPSPKLTAQSDRGRDTRHSSEGVSSKIMDGQSPDSLGLLMKYESNPALLRPAAGGRVDSLPTLCPFEALEVLVVDDSRLNRKMLLKCLRADGHECSECADGIEAVAAVKERVDHANGGKGKPFDAILMDYMMPNMDGPTATREIRALGYTSLIFGVTGNGLPADVAHFLSCGADRVLLKPLDILAFGEAMRDVRVQQQEHQLEPPKELHRAN